MIGGLAVGASWLAIGQILSQGYLILAAFVAAAVMGPAEFGLVTIQIVFVSGLLLLADGGFATALVREQEALRPRLRSLAFASGIAVGALAAVGVAFFVAPLAWSLMFLSAMAPIAAFALGQQASLVAELRFRAVGLSQAASALLGFLASAVLLRVEAHAWAIPISFAIYVIALTAIQAFAKGATGLAMGRVDQRSIRFAGGAFGSSAVNYFGSNVDYIIVGAALGPMSLGLYALGYIVSTAIQTRVMSIVNRAAYPLMVQMTSAERLRWYGSLLALVTGLATPVYALLYVLTPEAISLVFGSQWLDAIPVTRALLAAGLAFTIGTSVGPLLLATGRSDLLFAFGIIRIVGIGLAVGLVAPGGLSAVSSAIVAYAWIAVPFTIVVSIRVAGAPSDALASLRQSIPYVLPQLVLSVSALSLSETWVGAVAAVVALIVGLVATAIWATRSRGMI